MMACHVIFKPGSVVSIKSKTGLKSVSLVRTRVDGCVVARGFRRRQCASVNVNFHAFIRRRLDIISSSKDFC